MQPFNNAGLLTAARLQADKGVEQIQNATICCWHTLFRASIFAQKVLHVGIPIMGGVKNKIPIYHKIFLRKRSVFSTTFVDTMLENAETIMGIKGNDDAGNTNEN